MFGHERTGNGLRGGAKTLAPHVRWLAAFASVALVLSVAGSAAAQPNDVPIPRLSPLKQSPTLAGVVPASGEGDSDAGDDLMMEGGDGDFVGTEGEMPLEDAPLDLSPLANNPLALSAAPGPGLDLASPASEGPSIAGDASAIGTFTLDAKLSADGEPIAAGMTWRVFAADPESEAKLRLVGEATGGQVTLKLRPGVYFIHAAYGRAGATRRITVGTEFGSGTVVLNAGGLRLSALVGKDQPVPDGDISFDVYASDEGGTDARSLLVSDADPGKVIGLNAGVYHVVCRYGDANAVVRADIKVEPGKITDATVFQKAARLTLKLVETQGGEALANTQWSVVTPGGDSVADFVGAFPSVVLAAGDYTAIARHNGALYERTFTVEPGLNRDIEVQVR